MTDITQRTKIPTPEPLSSNSMITCKIVSICFALDFIFPLCLKKRVCYFTFNPHSMMFLIVLVDKVLEQLRGQSPNTSDRSHMNASVRITPGRGMILPFEPLSMSFNEINYYVDMPAVCCLSIIVFSTAAFHVIFRYYINDR
jgi:hypothetical protein